MVRTWSLLAGALLLLTGRSAHAELPPPGSPDSRPLIPTAPPPEEHPPSGAQGRLALTGLGVFGAWYGAAVAQSFGWKDAPAHERLLIPVVGPWMTIAHAGCSSSEPSCTDAIAVVRAILAGITAVGQVGGLGVLAESAFMRTESQQPKLARQSGVSIRSFSVVSARDGLSLGVSGAF